jgi:2-keto-3-deoxy-L-rhamnonate aldolase RhmA/quercetin dioxygenase-like cupin family protein
MNVRAIRALRRKLFFDEPVYGLWVTLDSASVSEAAVAMGLDWVVVDAEHGHLDWRDIVGHVRAAVRSRTVVLVRLAEANGGLIKRALDIGADGVVLPWIESADQLRRAVAQAHYPTAGTRGMGAERATAWGRGLARHASEANEHVLVVPIIETVEAGKHIEEICAVPGVEILQLGPADYSATAGYRGQWEGPGVAEALLAIKDAIRRHNKHCGVLSTGLDDLTVRRGQGFRFLGLGLDMGLLLRGLSESLAHVGRPAALGPDLTPAILDETGPGRVESIRRVPETTPVEVGDGVELRPLVGAHNQAHDLFTGLLAIAPESSRPYHVRPCGEALTLLEGEAIVDVEGRRYMLRPLDSLFIPRGLARRILNPSTRDAATFHIALDEDAPAERPFAGLFPETLEPEGSKGREGAERLTRHAAADQFELSPGAMFQDYFNAERGARGICGGFGRFQPGSRLPCHRHDFDESITIIEGTAVCVVEGRRYELSGNATALVPRGRCHYFINQSDAPMAMIWVYAGDMPDRIVMDEARCRGGAES